MSVPPSRKQVVFAVVRWDDGMSSIANAVTIKEILPTIEEADAEVSRLNAINGEKGCTYFAKQTKFYPDGRQAE